jgi:hypothetical protein
MASELKPHFTYRQPETLYGLAGPRQGSFAIPGLL